MKTRFGSAVAVLFATALSIGAPAHGQRPGRGARDTAGVARDSGRVVLEQRIRQRLWQVVRKRVGLNDEQMRRLQETERSLDAERRDINRAEVATRAKLRAAALDSARSQDDASVSALIDEFFRLQQQRLALQEKEQHELAAFMTPVQRVRFHALEEQLRRRVEALRRQRGAAAGAGALSQP